MNATAADLFADLIKRTRPESFGVEVTVIEASEHYVKAEFKLPSGAIQPIEIATPDKGRGSA